MFEPVFADELDVSSEVEEACMGNTQCIFDSTVTNDSTIGMGTLMTTMGNMENEAISGEYTECS